MIYTREQLQALPLKGEGGLFEIAKAYHVKLFDIKRKPAQLDKATAINEILRYQYELGLSTEKPEAAPAASDQPDELKLTSDPAPVHHEEAKPAPKQTPKATTTATTAPASAQDAAALLASIVAAPLALRCF